MKRAVIYARYSSDKQDESSIDAQARACEAYAASHGYAIIKRYYDEAISGKGSKTALRREYQHMLKDADKHMFDIVLIHKYDRIARNLREHANLEKRLSDNDITLIATAQDFGFTSEAKILKSMLWAMSEYYIDNLSNEVKKGHKETALKAMHNGGYAPFGYDVVDQKYLINEVEAAYVKRMFDCAVNRKGFTALIKEMSAAGITGKRGKPITYNTIYEILRNEKYTGTYLFCQTMGKTREEQREKKNAIRIENALPVIIGKAQFEEVQYIMKKRKQTGKKAGYLCSGLVYCGNCGAKMHGCTTHRKGHEYRKFYCSAKCGIGTIDMDLVDNAVKLYIEKLLDQDSIEALTQALSSYLAGEKSRTKEFTESIRHEIEKRQNQVDNYMITLGSGALPQEVISDIGAKIVSLKDEIRALESTEPPKDFTVPQIQGWLQSIRTAPDDKAVRLLIERINATKTEINMQSTLTSVLGKIGCGGRI